MILAPGASLSIFSAMYKQNSPTLTYSKMGAALHFVWRKVLPDQNGVLRDFNLDVDFICPLIPTIEVARDIKYILNYLDELKPVGWLDEVHKLTNTMEIRTETLQGTYEGGCTLYLCRLKLLSPGTVIASSGEPFISEESLTGTRKKVYIALKILKEATGAKITSYRLKASVVKVFPRQPSRSNLGKSVSKVLNHHTSYSGRIGDLFGSININLREKGYAGIDLDGLDDGFVRLRK